MKPRTLAALALSTSLVGLTACGEDGPANEPSEDTRTAEAPTQTDTDTETAQPGTAPQAEPLLTGLTTPWGVAALADGSLLWSSRDTAEISLTTADGENQVLRTVDDVRVEGESGLLGLALTPDESTLLAYFTAAQENRIVAMSFDGATLGEPEVIVDGIPGGATFHNGGALRVGPDDLLYVGTGDNGVPEDSQDPDSLSGKILRYTLDGQPAPDNPAGDAIFASGMRNVQGLAFDDEGRLWGSEFGSNQFDELNLIEAGENYGWPEVEGTGGGEEFVDPEVVWPVEQASPSGLAFYDGSLWMAALRGQTLWEIPLEGAGEGAEVGEPVGHFVAEYGRLRSVLTAEDGESLVLGTSNTDGRGEPGPDDDQLLRLTR